MEKVFIDGLSFALPLLIMAVGAIYSEKSGVTNLAVEGFQGVGAFVGALFAILLIPHMGNGNQTVIYLAMLAAAIGAGLYACLHALLCIKFHADQVISGVVINILAVALTTFFTSAANTAINGTASNKFILGVSNRFSVPGLSKIPWIGGFFTNMYPFEIIIIVLVIFFWYLMNKTRYGMSLRACGENPQAVDAAGGDVIKTRWIAVIIRYRRNVLRLLAAGEFLPFDLSGVRLPRYRGDDLRELEYRFDRAGLPDLRTCQVGWVSALHCHGTAQQLFGSVPDAALCADDAAAYFLLEEKSSSEGCRSAVG